MTEVLSAARIEHILRDASIVDHNFTPEQIELLVKYALAGKSVLEAPPPKRTWLQRLAGGITSFFAAVYRWRWRDRYVHYYMLGLQFGSENTLDEVRDEVVRVLNGHIIDPWHDI